MRSFIVVVTALALVALPCAWDSVPGDVPPVAAIVAAHAGLPAPAVR